MIRLLEITMTLLRALGIQEVTLHRVLVNYTIVVVDSCSDEEFVQLLFPHQEHLGSSEGWLNLDADSFVFKR